MKVNHSRLSVFQVLVTYFFFPKGVGTHYYTTCTPTIFIPHFSPTHSSLPTRSVLLETLVFVVPPFLNLTTKSFIPVPKRTKHLLLVNVRGSTQEHPSSLHVRVPKSKNITDSCLVMVDSFTYWFLLIINHVYVVVNTMILKVSRH